jgi:hypothetical protein
MLHINRLSCWIRILDSLTGDCGKTSCQSSVFRLPLLCQLVTDDVLYSLIDVLLQKAVIKGQITQEDKAATLSRISTTEDINDFASVDFVVEAVSEK